MSTESNDVSLPESLSRNITLSRDEQVLGVIQYRWLTWLWTMVTATVLIVGGAYLFSTYPDVVLDIVDPEPGDQLEQDIVKYESQVKYAMLASIALGILLFARVYIRKRGSGFVITNQRITKSKRGFFSTRSKEVRMEDIRSIETVQSGPLSLHQRGALQVRTGAGRLFIPARDANSVAGVIRKQKEQQ